MSKKSNLSKKLASIVAGSMALLAGTSVNATVENIINEDSNTIEFSSNKQLKPQLVLSPNFQNPGDSHEYMHASHSSHSSHGSHGSHNSHNSHSSHYSGY